MLTELLREEIVSGRIPAGSRLTVEEVATRYGVSAMPVREALQRLQGEGIIVLVPHRGARVVSLDENLVGNIYDLRGAVEALLARLSLPNLTNAAMARLEELHHQFLGAAAADDAERAFTINADFHHVLYKHANNAVALEIYDRYAGLLGALRRRYGIGPGRLSQRAASLTDVLDALRAKNAERLAKLAQTRCELSKYELLDLMRQEGHAREATSDERAISRLSRSMSRS